MLLLLGRGKRRQRPAVERALKGNDAVALWMAVRGLILPHHLDHALHRLGAGVREEDRVGKAHGAQTVCEPFALRNAVKIGDVHHLLGLRLDCLDQMGVRMAERVHSNARTEIEIAVAVGCNQPNALAQLESEVDARISRQHM